jgi:hypothetical protein
MKNNIFNFAVNQSDVYKLKIIFEAVKTYNGILFKYTKNFRGKISLPKTELNNIPKTFINIDEYINSKPVWKNILKFINTSTNLDLHDYIDTMIRNWNDISIILNCSNIDRPTANIIFSVKMLSIYNKIKDKEHNIKEINKSLNVTRDENFYRLSPSLQSNINSLFRLKTINPTMSYHDIIIIFSGEFEDSFKQIVLSINEKDISIKDLENKINGVR